MDKSSQQDTLRNAMLTGRRRIEPTSPGCRGSRRLEPGRGSTYRAGKTVRIDRASSELADPLGRPSQVGDDEADPGIQLALVPLDLGHPPPRLRPDLRLVG